MTPAALIEYVSIDPRQEVARLWAWVFEAPEESEPVPGDEPLLADGTRPAYGTPEYPAWDGWASATAQASAWRVKASRAGMLHPDAAHALALLVAADWPGVQPDDVTYAKQCATEEKE